MIIKTHEVPNYSATVLAGKKRRKSVKIACKACREAHIACSDERPCRQCLRRSKQCVDEKYDENLRFYVKEQQTEVRTVSRKSESMEQLPVFQGSHPVSPVGPRASQNAVVPRHASQSLPSSPNIGYYYTEWDRSYHPPSNYSVAIPTPDTNGNVKVPMAKIYHLESLIDKLMKERESMIQDILTLKQQYQCQYQFQNKNPRPVPITPENQRRPGLTNTCDPTSYVYSNVKTDPDWIPHIPEQETIHLHTNYPFEYPPEILERY